MSIIQAETEKWLCVEETDYEISDMGNVRKNTTQKRVLSMQRNGSLQVKLHEKNKQSVTRDLGSLVLETFTGKLDVEREVCYLNKNKLDNRLVNLYWSSQKKTELAGIPVIKSVFDCKISHKRSFLTHKSGRNSIIRKKRVAVW